MPNVMLQKELAHFGIEMIGNGKCRIDINGKKENHNLIRIIKNISKKIKQQEDVVTYLFDELKNVLDGEGIEEYSSDFLTKMFIFSLKDLSKFLLCFDDSEVLLYKDVISKALSRDINSFSKEQVSTVSDIKISIDWSVRLIHRLQYIKKLLYVATSKKIANQLSLTKVGRGVSGPWSNLDLPMEERAYPFEEEDLQGRTHGKQRQRRYRKGLENYHGGQVGEGHYWRELRNEPFSWSNRASEDPYPSRHSLSR
jgi:hypothetical protein